MKLDIQRSAQMLPIRIEWQHIDINALDKSGSFELIITNPEKANRRIWPDDWDKYIARFVTQHKKVIEEWAIYTPDNEQYVQVKQGSIPVQWERTVSVNFYYITIPMDDLHYVLAECDMTVEDFTAFMRKCDTNIDYGLLRKVIPSSISLKH